MLTTSVVLSILFLLPSAPVAAQEVDPRDYLPAIVKIEFGKWDIGFIAGDGRRLLFNRKARRFAQVPVSKYTTLMTGATDVASVPENLIAAINKTVTEAQPYSAVRLIAKDPFAATYWAVTITGLVQVTSDFKLSDSWYAADAFDDKTGAAIIVISTWAAPTDSLATFQIKLGISDTKAYYEAVSKIPIESRTCFDYQALSERPGDCPVLHFADRGKFLPVTFNVLLPFVIKSLDFSKETVWQDTQRLCLFKDKAAAALLAENADSGYFMSRTGDLGSQCIAYYRQAGILPDKPAPERLAKALERIKTELATGDSSQISGGYHRALDIAAGLAELGNPEGIELLNQYFIDSPGGTDDAPDSTFFMVAAQTLHYSDEFLPAILAGVEKFYGSVIIQGCGYLNVTYADMSTKNRLGVKQLQSLLIAVENATHPEKIPHQPSQAKDAYRYCRPALVSQLKDKSVRDDFNKNIYSHLPPAQKIIVDEIIKEQGLSGGGEYGIGKSTQQP